MIFFGVGLKKQFGVEWFIPGSNNFILGKKKIPNLETNDFFWGREKNITIFNFKLITVKFIFFSHKESKFLLEKLFYF